MPNVRHAPSPSNILETISISVSDLQQQLADAKKKADEQDKLIKEFQEELEHIKAEKQASSNESENYSKRRKTPRGLSVSILLHPNISCKFSFF